MSIRTVVLSEHAKRQLRRVPTHIVLKLAAWTELVETNGLDHARRVPGFHDELLRGRRSGQRSIRLNRAYRAIYVEVTGALEFLRIEEVSKHDY